MIFIIPLILIVLIYFRIVQFVKTNRFSQVNRNPILRQRRQQSELRLIRRILFLVIIIFILGFPYSFFYFSIRLRLLSSFPSVHRISYLFITFGQSASMLMNLITTDNVRKILLNQ